MHNKRGQITIFIILAIVIVAAVSLYFIFRNQFEVQNVPSTFEPVYNSFLSCVEQKTELGIGLLESQAGYIELPEFERGSEYMPFSSQLNFMGTNVPYWYYISGNNIEKQQIPSKENMQIQLENFLNEKIYDCNFGSYYDSGFLIEKGTPNAKVSINNNNVEVNLDMDLDMAKSDETVLISRHRVSVNSNLGNLYSSAQKFYSDEREHMFLENYTMDVLHFYAPVDGLEISCAPLTWNANSVFENISSALNSNFQFLRTGNKNSLSLTDEEKYFTIDTNVGNDVRVLYSPNWPQTFDVSPDDGNLLVAKPVGNQQALGVLGFCYIPYHFVYNLRFPTMIQIYNGDEFFQFPIAVLISGNRPGVPSDVTGYSSDEIGICDSKNTPVNVDVTDSDGNSVNAQIYYECFGESCYIGESPLSDNFPQCVNGYLSASAEGYENVKQIFSTFSSGGSVSLIMEKISEKQIKLLVDGKDYNGNALVSFTHNGQSNTLFYPEQNIVGLVQGSYDIEVRIYSNTSLNFGEMTSEQCVDVPVSGIGGLLGITDEQCFETTLPATVNSNVVSGGGDTTYYVLKSNLDSSSYMEINVPSLPEPKSLEQLQYNYDLVENKNLEINFK